MSLEMSRVQTIYIKRKKRKPTVEDTLLADTSRRTKTSLRFISAARATANMLIHLILISLIANNIKLVHSNSANRDQQDNTLGQNALHFLEEPRDTQALLGQPTNLACVTNKRGTLTWARANSGIIVSGSTVHTPYFGRISLLVPNSDNSDPPTGDQFDSSQSLGNYTLHIERVSFQDDSQFHCAVGLTPEGKILKSRSARLTVLQAPTQLSLSARYLSQQLEETEPNANNYDESLGGGEISSRVIFNEQIQNASDEHQAPAKQPMDIEPDEPIRIVVRQNERLRLECHAELAKPHTELVWLDQLQRPVQKRASQQEEGADGHSGTSNLSALSYVEEQIKIDPTNPKLSQSSLFWTLKVERHHANRRLTCLAKHPAFELQTVGLLKQDMRRHIILDVHYAPEIELLKDTSIPYEGKPLKFTCHADAHPNQLNYSWFIEDQLIGNVNGPELYIHNLTRQMHLREIKCKVSNSVGSSSKTVRLAVRYAPAYVTHLMPASLLPAASSHAPWSSETLPTTGSHAGRHHKSQLAGSGQTIGELLARGFDLGDTVSLRCDFDSNPRTQQVLWYKLETNYSIMKDVSPQEADELIAAGAAHAAFRSTSSLDLAPSEHEQSRRHIVATDLEYRDDNDDEENNNHDHSANANHEHKLTSKDLSTKWNNKELDFEKMSEELLAELRTLTSRAKQQNNDSGEQLVEQLDRQPSSQTNTRIYEPISWTVDSLNRLNAIKQLPGQPEIQQLGKSSNFGDADQSSSEHLAETAKQRQDTIVLKSMPLAGNSTGSLSAQNLVNKMNKREAQVTSSILTLRKASRDFTGLYVCKSEPVDKFKEMARAIYLVQREKPRIISCQHQWLSFTDSNLQIECMAQIHTVIDNQTSIRWLRSGKPIEDSRTFESEPGEGVGGRSVKIKYDYSPDLLFMRSTLHITGAQFSDYGLYNCVVTNSLGSDHMPINLSPAAPPGFLFAIIISVLIGVALILACVASLVISCLPKNVLFIKSAQAKARDGLKQKQASESERVSVDDATKNGGFDNMSEQLGQASSLEGKLNEDQQQGLKMRQDSHLQRAKSVSPDQLDLAMRVDNMPPGYSMVSANPMDNNISPCATDGIRKHHMRLSLRHEPGVGTRGALSSHPSRVSKQFAAIQETLENKFRTGPPQLNGRPVCNSFSSSNELEIDEQNNIQRNSADNRVNNSSQETMTEITDPNSIMNRFWSRLLSRPASSRVDTSLVASRGANRRPKTRPTISMPMNATRGQFSLGLKRSPLSTSLSMLDSVEVDNHIASGTSNHKSNYINGSTNLVSSKMNLIHDSTTASDNTVSSSRSSSCSGQNQVDKNNFADAQNQQNLQLAYTANQYAMDQEKVMWMAPTMSLANQNGSTLLQVAHHDLSTSNPLTNNQSHYGVYMNQQIDPASTQTYQPTSDLYLDYRSGMNHPPPPPPLQMSKPNMSHYPTPGMMTTSGISQMANSWYNSNQSAAPIGQQYEQYQLPIMNLTEYESYVNHLNGQQQLYSTKNLDTKQDCCTNYNSNGYGTLPRADMAMKLTQTTTSDGRVVSGDDKPAISDYATVSGRSLGDSSVGFASLKRKHCYPASLSSNSIASHNNELSTIPEQTPKIANATKTTDSQVATVIVPVESPNPIKKILREKGAATNV